MTPTPAPLDITWIRSYRAAVERGETIHLYDGEALACLAAAEALARLETWLRAKEEWRYLIACPIVGEGEMHVEFADGLMFKSPTLDTQAYVRGDTLLAALTAALDEVEKR